VNRDITYWLGRVAWLLAACCFLTGAWSCWRSCYVNDDDTINYLNIGQAFLRFDGSHLVNATWGPLYGVIAAIWLRVYPFGDMRVALKILNLAFLFLVLYLSLVLVRKIIPTVREPIDDAAKVGQVNRFGLPQPD